MLGVLPDVLEIAKQAGTPVARIENNFAPFEHDVNRGASGSQVIALDVFDGVAGSGTVCRGEDAYKFVDRCRTILL